MRRIIYIALGAFLLLITCSAYKANTTLDWQDKEVFPVIGEVGRNAFALATYVDARSLAGEDIYLVITSPGGDVFTGSIAISAMETAKHRGSKINCIVPVLAASMAMHYFNHCDRRYAFPEAFLLFHEAKGQAGPTQRQMAHAAEQMGILTRLLEQDLIDNLGTTKEQFTWHNVNETLWTSYEFIQAFPKWDMTLVRDVKLPATYDKSLFEIR